MTPPLTPDYPRRLLPAPRDRPDGLGAAGPAGGPGPGPPAEPAAGDERRLAVAGRRRRSRWRPLVVLFRALSDPCRIREMRHRGFSPATIDYFSATPIPSLFFGTLAGDSRRILQHPLHRPAGPDPLAVDGLVVHRGVGRVFRPDVLGDGRHDAADRLGGADHALPDARDDDDLPVPEHGAGEDETPVGGGGPQVFRLRIGLVGAVPVRAEHALRHDGDDLISTAIRKVLAHVGCRDRAGWRTTWPAPRRSC